MIGIGTDYAYDYISWVVETFLLDPTVYKVVSTANSDRYNDTGVNFTKHMDLCYDSGISEAFILTEDQYEQVMIV